MKRLIFLFIIILIQNQGFSQSYQWDNISVIHYDLTLSITNLASKQIQGKALLTCISQVNGVNEAYLYLEGLTVDSIFLADTILLSFIHHNDSILVIHLPAAFSVGDTIVLSIYYQGIPKLDPSGFGGFYFSSDNLYAYNLGVAFSSVPHSYGRVWFPCIDHFDKKATYDLKVYTQYPQRAICGGTLVNIQLDTATGILLSHWKIRQPIPSYLVSVAVSDYVLIADTAYGIAGLIPIHIYVRQPDSIKVYGSFVNLKPLLLAYEQLFGEYKWDRVGYVAVPFNYGAMEHAMNIAYPRLTINGATTYENLMAHELAHSWFGNLLTCMQASEMWINEAWAEFAELLYYEILYGQNQYRNAVRALLKDVLQNTHVEDEGYWPVGNVPDAYTYGSTVYYKGALVVNALRHYLGDSLFFPAVQAMLHDFAFSNITTTQMETFLSQYTGINLQHFFDAWVRRPGFSTFVIDSMQILPSGSQFNVTLHLRQLLRGTTQKALSNKFEILFLGTQFQKLKKTVFLPSSDGSVQVTLPFQPVAALIDPENKTVFATTHYNLVVRSNQNLFLSHTFNRIITQTLQADSVQLFIRHHWVAPDHLFDTSYVIYRISPDRYWEIDGLFAGENIEVRFQYTRTTTPGGLDNALLVRPQSADSLVLLYREGSHQGWRIIPFVKQGTSSTGYLSTTIQPGQYALGIGKPNQSFISEENNQKRDIMKVFPNPSGDEFIIELEKLDSSGVLYIFDSQGSQVDKISINKNKKVSWKPNGNAAGMYIIQLRHCKTQEVIDSKSVIYQK